MNNTEVSVKREKISLSRIISKLATHKIVVAVMFAVLTAIAAQISAPLPFSPCRVLSDIAYTTFSADPCAPHRAF